MRRRVKLKRKIKLRKKHTPYSKSSKIMLILFLIIMGVILTLSYANKRVTPVLVHYAETEIKRLSNLIINRAISKQMTEEMNLDDLFLIDKTNTGEINTIDFNPVIVNKVLATCTATVQLNLKYVEQGSLSEIDIPDTLLTEYKQDKLKKGVIYEIPSGVIFKNTLLSNLGPKIPVRLNLVGDIESNIYSKITNYGINNALIEVFVKITVNEQVILPFATKSISVSTDIPVAMKLMSGKVPNSYFGNIDKISTTLSVPAA